MISYMIKKISYVISYFFDKIIQRKKGGAYDIMYDIIVLNMISYIILRMILT